jgi:hypothetical protein
MISGAPIISNLTDTKTKKKTKQNENEKFHQLEEKIETPNRTLRK